MKSIKKFMVALMAAIISMCLPSCAMTPTQKKAVIIGASIIIVGAIIANQSNEKTMDDQSRKQAPGPPCQSDPRQCQ